RLAVVQRARQAGFSLDEIRALFFGFHDGTPAAARWQKLANRKLVELNVLAEQIASMQALLRRMKANCHCKTLEVCGKAILEKGIPNAQRPPLPVAPPRVRHSSRNSNPGLLQPHLSHLILQLED